VTVRRWENSRVVVLGLARQGKALARFLTGEGAMVVLSDIKTRDELGAVMTELAELKLTYVLGEHPLELLDDAQALFLSGGVPSDLPIACAARAHGIPVLNDAQLFLERCPAQVIGITGSAGKTTTTTLVDQMARLAFKDSARKVWLGGNIGRPLLDDLTSIEPQDVVVMELSSFQLELMTISPAIAALLNLTPDHLDRHGNMEAYVDAKRRILTYQDESSTAVIGYDDLRTWELHQEAKGRVIAFGCEKPEGGDAAYVEGMRLILRLGSEMQMVCGVDELALKGAHNLLNVLAACALSSTIQVPVEAMAEIARTFRGVPHRLEFVASVHGVDWYNDSIATTPDRALAAVRSFDEPLVLLLGGRDKDLLWETFANEVILRARMIILFGEAVPKLAAVFMPILEGKSMPELHLVEDLERAVATAAELVQTGDVVLLSPGCTSYDEFSNFEERGDRFREMVRSL
jgi:UDP-N-acetylmuramoylalanine--D-glutamate ligase